MKEKSDLAFLVGVCSVVISTIFLALWLAGGAALWIAGRLALVFALVGLAFVGLAAIFDEISERKPMVEAYPWRYYRLKVKTIRKLRKLKEEGKLTQNEIQKRKGAFLVFARKCGVDQEKARDDFELKIRKAVMNHDDT